MYLFYWVMSNVVFALHLYGFWVLHKSKSLHPVGRAQNHSDTQHQLTLW